MPRRRGLRSSTHTLSTRTFSSDDDDSTGSETQGIAFSAMPLHAGAAPTYPSSDESSEAAPRAPLPSGARDGATSTSSSSEIVGHASDSSVASANKVGDAHIHHEDAPSEPVLVEQIGPQIPPPDAQATTQAYHSEFDMYQKLYKTPWYSFAQLVAGQAGIAIERLVKIDNLIPLPPVSVSQRAEGYVPYLVDVPPVFSPVALAQNNAQSRPSFVTSGDPPDKVPSPPIRQKRRPDPPTTPDAVRRARRTLPFTPKQTPQRRAPSSVNNGPPPEETPRTRPNGDTRGTLPYPYPSPYRNSGALARRDLVRLLNRYAAQGVGVEQAELISNKHQAFDTIQQRFPHLRVATIDDFVMSTDFRSRFAGVVANLIASTEYVQGRRPGVSDNWQRIQEAGRAALEPFRYAHFDEYAPPEDRIVRNTDREDAVRRARQQQMPWLQPGAEYVPPSYIPPTVHRLYYERPRYRMW